MKKYDQPHQRSCASSRHVANCCELSTNPPAENEFVYPKIVGMRFGTLVEHSQTSCDSDLFI
jgi:hypothetical protein